jgi:hypothetical protein
MGENLERATRRGTGGRRGSSVHVTKEHPVTGRRKDNVDRFRKDIDRGRAGDKTDYPDPAAAPLGTDDEAGGHPATQEQLRIAREAEFRRRPVRKEDAPAVDPSRGRPNAADEADD